MFERVELGLKAVKAFEVDDTFFDEFRKVAARASSSAAPDNREFIGRVNRDGLGSIDPGLDREKKGFDGLTGVDPGWMILSIHGGVAAPVRAACARGRCSRREAEAARGTRRLRKRVRGRHARELDAPGVHGRLPVVRGVVRGDGARGAAGHAGDGRGVPGHARGRGKRPSTIQRALVGIAHVHRARGYAWLRGAPIGQVMSGIRRRHGTAPAQKAPLADEDLAALVGTRGEGLVGLRDRAVLTLGWMGAFRRSEVSVRRGPHRTRRVADA